MSQAPDDKQQAQRKARAIMDRARYTILDEDDRTPVEVDTAAWLDWCQKAGGISLQIAHDVVEGTLVSTIFMSGVSFRGLPPLKTSYFETMCFGEGGRASTEGRYATRDEAEEGHAEIVRSLTPEPTPTPATPRQG